MPHELVEAARIDGANAWNTFWRVVLPLIMPAVMITTTLRLIWTANFFDLILILTNGGPANASLTIPLYAYQTAYRGMDFGLGAALAVAQAAFLGVLVAPLHAPDQEERDRMSASTNAATFTANRNVLSRIRPIYFLIAAWLVGVLGPYVWMFITSVTPPTELATIILFPSNPTLAAFPAPADRDPVLPVPGQQHPGGDRLRRADGSLRAPRRHRAVTLPIPRPAGRPRRRPVHAALPEHPADRARSTSSSRRSGLIDNKIGLILMDTTFALAFSTWLIKGFVDQIPIEIEEAAYVDGCSKWQAFRHIILPLTRPGHHRRRHLRVHLLLERVPVRR